MPFAPKRCRLLLEQRKYVSSLVFDIVPLACGTVSSYDAFTDISCLKCAPLKRDFWWSVVCCDGVVCSLRSRARFSVRKSKKLVQSDFYHISCDFTSSFRLHRQERSRIRWGFHVGDELFFLRVPGGYDRVHPDALLPHVLLSSRSSSWPMLPFMSRYAKTPQLTCVRKRSSFLSIARLLLRRMNVWCKVLAECHECASVCCGRDSWTFRSSSSWSGAGSNHWPIACVERHALQFNHLKDVGKSVASLQNSENASSFVKREWRHRKTDISDQTFLAKVCNMDVQKCYRFEDLRCSLKKGVERRLAKYLPSKRNLT